MEVDIRRRTIGVNFKDGHASVKVWAPEAAKVALTSGEKVLPLAREGFGFWKLQTSALMTGDRYGFSIDDARPLPDPASLAQPDGVHGLSQAVDLSAFEWSDAGWRNIPLEQYILYELHTGTFSDTADFAGIEQKLDHLLDLGVNAIEIMPVAQFPGARNWGYDGVYPFAVHHSYGGARGLQQLVNECHRRGIAVVLDVVYNHMGPEGNYFGSFGPFFTEKYHTPWGGAINFDDQWCDGVRQYFIENALMWFRDFHIDALRLDAVHAIKDFSPQHILRAIRQQTDQLMKATGRRHYLIVESDLNDTRFINPVQKEGYGMDAQWIDEFHHALRVASGEPRTGYYSDFNGLEHLAKAYRDAYVYDGQFSEHRKRTFGVPAAENPGRQFIVFSQNHDQVGNRMLGERSSQLVSFEMQKLMAAAVLLGPFIPMLFMGEEWGTTSPFQYFVSHTDPDLAEAVRKGRKAEFAAFHAEGEAPDPMAVGTFEQSKPCWKQLDEENHKALFRYYKQMIRFRKEHPVLKELNRKTVNTTVEGGLLQLHRWRDEIHLMAVMNFGRKPVEVFLPPEKQWRCLINSADPQWKGPSTVPRYIQGRSALLVPPEAVVVYTNENGHS